MTKSSLILVLFLLISAAVSAVEPREALNELAERLEEASYQVIRHVEETGAMSVVRVERVIKAGTHKHVSVVTPLREYCWLRSSMGEFVIISNVAFEPLVPIMDSEDSFLEAIKRGQYEISLFLVFPSGYRAVITDRGMNYDVVFTDRFRISKLIKTHELYSVTVNYRDYQSMTEEAANTISTALSGMRLIRPTTKLLSSFVRENFEWMAMDFSYDGKSSLYILYLQSSAFGRLTLYALFGGDYQTLNRSVEQIAVANHLNHFTIAIGSSSAMSVVGKSSTSELETILNKLLGLGN